LLPRVLIVVTVETKQLPIAAVGWIVIVIVVFMMDGEFPQYFATKFATARRAYLNVIASAAKQSSDRRVGLRPPRDDGLGIRTPQVFKISKGTFLLTSPPPIMSHRLLRVCSTVPAMP
jgi:hypothetical protein